MISLTYAQNKFEHGRCRDVPMKSGEIKYTLDTGTVRPHHPMTSFVVSSKNGDVYSMADGKVVGVTDVNKYETVGVTFNGKDTLLLYLMITKAAVKAGDILKKGDLIGTGTPNEKTGKTESAILVKVYAKAYTMPNKEVMAFIDRMNN